MEPELFKPHPDLSREINDAIADSELQGGCRFDEVPENQIVRVQTHNTLYELVKRGGKEYIRGNQNYCPDWTECRLSGSTWGGSMLKVRFIGRGMRMEAVLVDGFFTTSEIREVSLLNKTHNFGFLLCKELTPSYHSELLWDTAEDARGAGSALKESIDEFHDREVVVIENRQHLHLQETL